jgi:hypothetical protein
VSRVGRLLLGAFAAAAALGVSLLAAAALLGVDPLPGSDEAGSGPATLGTSRTDDAVPRDRRQAPMPGQATRGSDGVASAQLFAPGARGSWAALKRSLPARIGVALAPLGTGAPRGLGSLQSGHAWSTIKVPILVTLMRERDNGLSSEEGAWASAALTSSDNDAAAALFGAIERSHGGLAQASAAIESTLRIAGDAATTVATAPPPSGAISTFGQTEWSLSASARFFRALAGSCLLGSAGTARVLELMEGVVADQRWGLGAVAFDPGWRVAFKGGWGPDGSASGPYLVRQSGVLRDGEAGVAVALAAQADNGSFEDGVEAIDRAAAWLADNLRPAHGHAPPTC